MLNIYYNAQHCLVVSNYIHFQNIGITKAENWFRQSFQGQGYISKVKDA